MDELRGDTLSRHSLSYNDYLAVPQLLKLQQPQSSPPHHDEMLFIIIHQTYELWFKLVLHEMESALYFMEQANVLKAHHFVRRVVEIFKVLVSQIHILETMAPAEFLQFRDRLNPASGFQSLQFREVEFLAGLKDEGLISYFKERSQEREILEKRLKGSDLRQSYYTLLRIMGYEIPAAIHDSEEKDSPKVREQVFSVLRYLYEQPGHNLPLYLLTESLIDFDQTLLLWRTHHMRVVERVIGFKRGTGGSTGVGYLHATTGKKCFPYLWEVRTVLDKDRAENSIKGCPYGSGY